MDSELELKVRELLAPDRKRISMDGTKLPIQEVCDLLYSQFQDWDKVWGVIERLTSEVN